MKNRIKELRAKHNLTQQALADKVGLRRETIVHFENGDNYPSLRNAYDIAKYFHLTIEEVFILDENPEAAIINTEDGSHSLYLPNLNETYHSTHGAIQESNHVYIETGLKTYLASHPDKQNIHILEYGFGTGLNALLTAQVLAGDTTIHYHSLELYPLKNELFNLLNYGKLLEDEMLFEQLHTCSWGHYHNLTDHFKLRKTQIDFRDFHPNQMYDIIYFDAFDPAKQPELWTKSILKRCYQSLNKHGVMVTYSAKGQLKRDLKSIGFIVESLPGPPGKFEITRAVKE